MTRVETLEISLTVPASDGHAVGASRRRSNGRVASSGRWGYVRATREFYTFGDEYDFTRLLSTVLRRIARLAKGNSYGGSGAGPTRTKGTCRDTDPDQSLNGDFFGRSLARGAASNNRINSSLLNSKGSLS